VPNVRDNRAAAVDRRLENALSAAPCSSAILDEAELSKPWRSRGGRGGCADGRMRSFRES